MFSLFTMLYWILSLFRQYGIFLFFILFLRFQDRILDPFQLFFFYFISKILILDVGPVQTEWYIFFHLISMILILNLFHCSESVIFSFFCVFFFYNTFRVSNEADNYRLFIGQYCGDSGPEKKKIKKKYHSVN
jgi:hypothetical protein